jgi:Ca2+-binding EF-hand superfamily protein
MRVTVADAALATGDGRGLTTDSALQVDAEDFYQYVARKEETMWRTFQDLDIDGTGEVDDEELLQALRWGLLAPMCA